jgi:hypothetical protein
MIVLLPESVFLGSVDQTIAAMDGQSIAPTLEAGIKKDSGPYTFVHNL